MWRRGRQYWSWVYTSEGRVRRSLDTADSTTAREIERMLGTLRERREWRLLNAAARGSLGVGKLLDFWRREGDGIAELRAQLDDVNLNDHVDGWRTWVCGHADESTADTYVRQLRALIPDDKPFLRSAFTRVTIFTALYALAGSNSTKKRYAAAWSSFSRYLVEREVLESNPLRLITVPSNNKPREIWLDLPDSTRLVKAQPAPFRAMAALREGAGVEISAALTVRRRDVDERGHIVHVHGTKNARRDRAVLVDDWAWPIFMEAVRGKLPDALLFDGVTRFVALNVHRAAVKALGLPSAYTMHDSRHSYAVRWMKAGANPQDIANNLGHRDASQVIKCYGKYRHSLDDLRRAREARKGRASR